MQPWPCPSAEYIGLSMPVAFQNPDPVTLFGLTLFLYFLPLLQKKYHSLSVTVLLFSAYFQNMDESNRQRHSFLKIYK